MIAQPHDHVGGLEGRVALVTGAARGIGLAVSVELANAGARVVMVDIDSRALELVASQVEGSVAVCADVTSPQDAEGTVAATLRTQGRLDVLVNNAGICPLTPFEQISAAEWDRVLDVNLKAAFLFSQAAFPHICAAGVAGRIINISSVGGQMGGVLVGVHYAASKAGLLGLTKSLARMLAPHRATANAVAPATTATDLTAAWPADLQARVRSQIPLGRYGEAVEIAAAVRFLASDDAAFITGATIDVNGGLYLR